MNQKQPELRTAKRIGILGGAFDPIHYGHLTAAECARCEKNLDFVLFIPTGTPPHKGNITYNQHRYMMTLLATADNPYFYTSRMELDRPGPSYTVDTLRILKESTDGELFFIVGADEMLQLSAWKNSHLLPGLCNWIAVTRPGYENEKIEEALKIPGLEISGTDLRARIKSKQPVKYLVTKEVERYINDLGLYGGYEVSHEKVSYEEIHKAVAGKLSQERYKHTLGVLETAILLAARHNINLRKTYLAALLHDYAKELDEEEKRARCKEFNIQLDPIQERYINLTHGQLGAELARQEFNIQDQEILSAISYHTTGRPGMGTLERIIKIADNIEPNRREFDYTPDVRADKSEAEERPNTENKPNSGDKPDSEKILSMEAIRSLSSVNLDKACAAAIRRDIEYTIKKGHAVHPRGLEALKDLENRFGK